MKPGNINRYPFTQGLFSVRDTDVKWPTLRGGWLNDDVVAKLRNLAVGMGKSIIFLDGTYQTNLNQHTDKSPIERAVFFEWAVKVPTKQRKEHTGWIFLLSWIGNFHNGSIFHCAYQYPQVQEWERLFGKDYLDYQAANLYRFVTSCIYPGGNILDDDVAAFVQHIKENPCR